MPKIHIVNLLCLNIPVMFFLHKMVACSEGYEMGVIRRSGYGNRPCAAHIRVTQLISQTLQLIRVKMIIIPQHVVV